MDSSAQDFDQLVDNFFELCGLESADPVKHQRAIGGKDPIRPHIAELSQAAGYKVFISKEDRITIVKLPAGDLAEDQIVALQRTENESRASLGIRQV
jgi:hypothetical protein